MVALVCHYSESGLYGISVTRIGRSDKPGKPRNINIAELVQTKRQYFKGQNNYSNCKRRRTAFSGICWVICLEFCHETKPSSDV